MPRQRGASQSDIENIVNFWRSSQGHWFSKSPRFDRRFRDAFLPLHDAVVARRHDDWIEMHAMRSQGQTKSRMALCITQGGNANGNVAICHRLAIGAIEILRLRLTCAQERRDYSIALATIQPSTGR